MKSYREIDVLVKTYQDGRESPRGSARREKGRAAGELLALAFKPLVLSVISAGHIPGPQMEDALQDGLLAFIEGLGRFDPGHGGAFNAFIQAHLRQYFKKWISGRFNRSVTADKRLEDKAPGAGALTLAETLEDKNADTDGSVIQKETDRVNKIRLDRGLSRLTPKQRAVIFAHYRQGLSLRDIARAQGITHQSVCETHARALLRLRTAFTEPL